MMNGADDIYDCGVIFYQKAISKKINNSKLIKTLIKNTNIN